MKRGLIGIQMSTIKKKIDELGAYETLKKCAELGYHCVEVSQVNMTPENVAGMKKACDEFGIKIAACTASLEPMIPGMPGETLATDFDKIVADCKTLNCDMLRIGMLPMTCMGSREKALEFVKRADEMAERLKAEGIDLGEESGLDAYVLCLAPQAKTAALQLVTQLRSSGYRCDMDYLGRSFKAQFKSVERKHARTAIFLGDKELESGEVTIKEIDTQKQHTVPLNDIVAVMDRLFDETQEAEGGCTCGHVHE